MTTVFPMGPADALFLEHERRTPAAVNTIGGFVRFRGSPPGLTEFRAFAAGRLAAHTRFRLIRAPAGGRLPRWEAVPGFDIRQNMEVTKTRADGLGALRKAVAALVSQRLPTESPPWRLTMVTGYAPDEFAVLLRAHHALLDGASISMCTSLLYGPEGLPIDPGDGGPAWVPGTVRGTAVAAWDLTNRSAPLNAGPALGEDRHLSLGSVPRATVRAAREQPVADGRPTVNDVYLAAVSGALRALLPARSGRRLLGTAHVGVPVNIRAPESRYMLGNGLSFLRVPMPLGVASPAGRLDAVTRAMREARERDATSGNVLLIETFARIGGPLLSSFARFGLAPRSTPVICANVPVADLPMACAGRPHLQSAGIPFLPHRHGFSVLLVTSGDDLTLSVLADLRLREFADLLVTAVETEFARLAEPAGRVRG
ncbi:WS/DGAT domain-containing protein [Spirillospora sp. NPDC047279]|uniref:wax ester/triacylglycerol synthase domain-containing protein n=1 Tax=Spirillospora sp. NPDC047279 TaxID=3155478 RepID=UPI003405EE94